MNSRVILTVSLLIVLICVIVSTNRHVAARDAETALKHSRMEVAELSARLRSTEQRQQTSSSPTGTGVTASAAEMKASEKRSSSKAAPERSLESTIDRLAMSNPALQDLYVKQQTIRFPQRFGFLYAVLGLSPSQIDQFERVMAQHAQTGIDVAVSALKQGLQKDDSAAGTLMNRAFEERNQQLRALLGESGYQEFLWQERNARWRSLADTLAQNLYYTESPMSRESALELTKTLSSNAERNQGKVDWPEVISDARRFLTPTQIRALENHREIVMTGAQVAEILKASGIGTDSTSSPKP